MDLCLVEDFKASVPKCAGFVLTGVTAILLGPVKRLLVSAGTALVVGGEAEVTGVPVSLSPSVRFVCF